MKIFCILCLIAVISASITVGTVYYFIEAFKLTESEEQALHYYTTIEPTMISEFIRSDWAEWIYKTSSVRNNKTTGALIEARHRFAKYCKKIQNGINIFKWTKFYNQSLQATFRHISKIFVPFVTSWDETLIELQRYIIEEDIIRAQVKENITSSILNLRNASSSTTPINQVEVEAESEKLKWTIIQNELGLRFAPQFKEFIRIFNSIGESRGFIDGIDMFLTEEYQIQSGSVQNLMKFVWKNLQPLYEQIHGFYRWSLVNKFGQDEIMVTKRGTIPLNVIPRDLKGNWIVVETNISNPVFRLIPTDLMNRLNWTPLKLHEEVDRYFMNINFTSFSKTFWTNLKVVGNNHNNGGVEIKRNKFMPINTGINKSNICEHIQYISGNISDYRMSACQEVSISTLRSAYEEIGIMKHFILSSNQTFYPLRRSEMELLTKPLGLIWGMLAMLPKNLRRLSNNLKLKSELDHPEVQRGFLFQEALGILPRLAELMSYESWRWSVFQNKTVQPYPYLYNCHYWKIRNEIEGIKPPITRKSTDFDPVSFPINFQPYGATREFIILVLQYQIFRSLCIQAGEYNNHISIQNGESTTADLHQCDFSKNSSVIEKLKKFMKNGSSKSWLDNYEELTGERDNVNPGGILEYFKPLHEWLIDFNAKNSIHVGWLGSVEEYPSCTNTRK